MKRFALFLVALFTLTRPARAEDLVSAANCSPSEVPLLQGRETTWTCSGFVANLPVQLTLDCLTGPQPCPSEVTNLPIATANYEGKFTYTTPFWKPADAGVGSGDPLVLWQIAFNQPSGAAVAGSYQVTPSSDLVLKVTGQWNSHQMFNASVRNATPGEQLVALIVSQSPATTTISLAPPGADSNGAVAKSYMWKSEQTGGAPVTFWHPGEITLQARYWKPGVNGGTGTYVYSNAVTGVIPATPVPALAGWGFPSLLIGFLGAGAIALSRGRKHPAPQPFSS